MQHMLMLCSAAHHTNEHIHSTHKTRVRLTRAKKLSEMEIIWFPWHDAMRLSAQCVTQIVHTLNKSQSWEREWKSETDLSAHFTIRIIHYANFGYNKTCMFCFGLAGRRPKFDSYSSDDHLFDNGKCCVLFHCIALRSATNPVVIVWLFASFCVEKQVSLFLFTFSTLAHRFWMHIGNESVREKNTSATFHRRNRRFSARFAEYMQLNMLQPRRDAIESEEMMGKHAWAFFCVCAYLFNLSLSRDLDECLNQLRGHMHMHSSLHTFGMLL